LSQSTPPSLPSAAPPKLVSAKDLAAYFGVSVATIRVWVKAKKLPPPVQICRRWRWDMAKIVAFIS
jgi:predicted DNA-binding transcriptional regulator AlpA